MKVGDRCWVFLSGNDVASEVEIESILTGGEVDIFVLKGDDRGFTRSALFSSKEEALDARRYAIGESIRHHKNMLRKHRERLYDLNYGAPKRINELEGNK